MLFKDAPGMAQEQGITVFTRRAWLRVVGLTLLAIGLEKPILALADTRNDLLASHPWMQPWIQQDGFKASWLQTLLGSLELDQRVITLMDHQAEAKPYYEYRALFINKARMQTGRRMMKKHRALLARVEADYRVPAAFVVALWGIESDFGKNMGQFNVLRTLFTLSVNYPRRADFFRNELREFLLICKEEGWDPRVPKGSYAGAFGQLQMMPSTMRRFAVDFNQDGKREVVRDLTDILASIAAFLKGYGWCLECPVIMPLEFQPKLADLFSSDSSKNKKTWQEWRSLGVVWPPHTKEPSPDESLALIILEERNGPRYYMTFKNFWVITQWNRSNRFAMAVQEFASELHKQE